VKLRSLTLTLFSLMSLTAWTISGALAQTPVPPGATSPSPVAAPQPSPATPAPGQNITPTPVPVPQRLPPPPPTPPAPVSDAFINSPGIEANLPAKIDVSGIAAVVGGKPITYQYLVTKFIAAGAPQFLDELINEQLLRNEGKKEGVTVSAAAVTTKLVEAKRFLLQQYPGETWGQFLALQGRSESYVRDNIYDGLLAVRLIEKSSATTLAGKVHFYHILKFTEAVEGNIPETDAVAQQQIADIRALILSGKATFQQEAIKESQDSTASKGGDLGWIGPDAHLDPSFAKAAFALKEGEISQPVKSQFGWHLIWAAKYGQHATPDEVADYNSGPEADDRARQGIQAYLAQLKKSEGVELNVLQKPAALKPSSMPIIVHPQLLPATH
jgi:hypothetical protein